MDRNSRAKYYEDTNFSSVMESRKGKRIIPTAKRITMNISERIYDEANELDGYLSMGYQNVLKTAMTIGLTELYHQVSSHKIAGK
jgi:hypothetical protein